MIPEFINCEKCSLKIRFWEDSSAYTDSWDDDHSLCKPCCEKIREVIDKTEQDFFSSPEDRSSRDKTSQVD